MPFIAPSAPKCARCAKSVYAAEQVVGPMAKIYHKPCLACSACGKRLDSTTLVEHEGEPYCKTCHARGYKPQQDHYGLAVSPSASPARPAQSPPGSPRSRSPALVAPRPHSPRPQSPLLRAPSPLARPQSPSITSLLVSPPSPALAARRPPPIAPKASALARSPAATATPLLPSSPASSPSSAPATPPLPARPPAPSIFASPSRKPFTPPTSGTPLCGTCAKPVYFAERAQALGRVYHKLCLKCGACGARLDPGKVLEKEGQVVCRVCYAKNFGPAGQWGQRAVA